jgi:hypothetical protein
VDFTVLGEFGSSVARKVFGNGNGCDRVRIVIGNEARSKRGNVARRRDTKHCSQVREVEGPEDRSVQTVQKVISFIVAVNNAGVNELSFDDTVLPAYESFGDFFES